MPARPSQQHLEWSQLMLAAQNGEAASYARLLTATTPFLRDVAERRLGKIRDAERAVQQALLTIHRLRHTYDPRRPIGPWLTAIVEAEARRLGLERAGPGPFGAFAAQLRARLVPSARRAEGNVNLVGV